MRPAFVLFGDLPKLAPYLVALVDRDLTVLVVTGPPDSSMERRANELASRRDQPFGAIDELSVQSRDDQPAILAQLAEWERRYTIAGIFSAAETFVEVAGVASDLLGLPGPGLRASRTCRNKHLQRLYLRPWSPRFALLTGESAAAVQEGCAGWYPLVVKPLALYSSIGVRPVPDAGALTEVIAGLAPADRFLVEERVVGREFSVETIVVGGKPAATSITQKRTNEDSSLYFVEMAHTVPAQNLSEAESHRMLDVNRAVIERLAFGTGMTHAEYRLTEDGRVVVMEVAARPGGGAILALHHLGTGEPLEAALVAAALGEEVSYPLATRHARQVYLPHTPGTLRDVSAVDPAIPPPSWLVDAGAWPVPRPADPQAPAAVRHLLVLKGKGEPLVTITESSNRAVTMLLDAPTAAELDLLETRIRQAVKLDIAS